LLTYEQTAEPIRLKSIEVFELYSEVNLDMLTVNCSMNDVAAGLPFEFVVEPILSVLNPLDDCVKLDIRVYSTDRCCKEAIIKTEFLRSDFKWKVNCILTSPGTYTISVRRGDQNVHNSPKMLTCSTSSHSEGLLISGLDRFPQKRHLDLIGSGSKLGQALSYKGKVIRMPDSQRLGPALFIFTLDTKEDQWMGLFW
jgi:hypothetical protein